MNAIAYTLKHFRDLSATEVYQIIQLRIEVFVVEQNCPYQDCDDRDFEANHLMGFDDNGKLKTYCRILAPGVSYPEYSSIGRVITAQSVRGTGEGRVLMERAIQLTLSQYPEHDIKISAQSYALPFYRSLGFVEYGAEYLEDDIPHMAMVFNRAHS